MTRDENAILAYYQMISEGTETVGKWVKLLYEVILQGLSDKRWYYDHRRAMNAIGFLERYCHHNKGPLAPGRIELQPWQRASISLIYGIVDKDGRRQWREVFWVIGRKMGKSVISGGVGNYEAFVFGDYGSELYFLGPKLEQASICYDAFEFNVQNEPELAKRTKSTKTKGLYIAESNTTVKRLCFSDRKSDGYNPQFYNADEVSSWPGLRGLRQWEVMASGTGAREQPMGFAISSAGYEREGLYDEFMARGTGVLNGTSHEEHLLPIIYMIDDPAKWDDLNELKKSLPGLGVSVSYKFILDEIATARESKSKKTEFLTKYCNVPQQSTMAWFDAETVNKMFNDENGVPFELTMKDFEWCYAIGGIDLSQTTDLTSACVLVEKDDVIWVFSHFWLPAEKLQEATERDEIPYQIMIEKGFLSLSGDNFVDYHDVFRWFTDLIEVHKIAPLITGYDRYSAQYLIQDMQAYGFHMDSVFQGYNLSGILDNLEGLMKNRQIRCADNNSLLKVHFMDAAQKLENNTDAHPRKKLEKVSRRAHVDGVAAVLDALCMRQNCWSELGGQLQNRREEAPEEDNNAVD